MKIRFLLPGPLKDVLRLAKRSYLDFHDRRELRRRITMGLDPELTIDVKLPSVRLGQGDGEWRLWREPPGEIVYCVGVGMDVSFDLGLIARFGVEVHAFDPTPIARDWLKNQSLPTEFNFHPWGLANVDGEANFVLPLGHYVSYAMKNDEVEVSTQPSVRGEVLKILTIMSRLGHNRVDLLKMDIEGSEYSVISDIIESKVKVGQILVEFHHRMIGSGGVQSTVKAVAQLRGAGYLLYDISPRGLEFAFVHRSILRD